MNNPTLHNHLHSSTWQQIMMGAGSAAGSTAAVISEESMKCLKYCSNWLQYAIQHISEQVHLLKNYISLNQSEIDFLDPIKNEIISTLKKVIDIISQYASNALPYHAKTTVRNTILSLPNRWAALNNDNTAKQSSENEQALKLLVLGQESNEMLSSINQVFEDTIHRAESWLERFKLPPITTLNENQAEDDDADFYNLILAPIRNLQISS